MTRIKFSIYCVMMQFLFIFPEGLVSLANAEGFHVSSEMRSLADSGDARAQYYLGRLYQYYNDEENSLQQALEWYCKAAEQGDTNAQVQLGDMYGNGLGVQQSDEQAIRWYRMAAQLGSADGIARLHRMYLYEQLLESDLIELISWVCKSAEQGDVRAQFYLGYYYYHGYGVQQDYSHAYAWLSVAYASNKIVTSSLSEDIINFRRLAVSKLTKELLKNAQLLESQLLKKYQ